MAAVKHNDFSAVDCCDEALFVERFWTLRDYEKGEIRNAKY